RGCNMAHGRMIPWCHKLKDSEVYPSNPIHTMPCRDYAGISLPIAQKKIIRQAGPIPQKTSRLNTFVP
ncbi:MAG: hypothetical protein KKG88_04725, partial [Proteobacteria bacterium]|nr:hypothetical protein [Pseudomonadota bacterium]